MDLESNEPVDEDLAHILVDFGVPAHVVLLDAGCEGVSEGVLHDIANVVVEGVAGNFAHH